MEQQPNDNAIIAADPERAIDFDFVYQPNPGGGIDEQEKAMTAIAAQVVRWYDSARENTTKVRDQWKANLRDYSGIRINQEKYPLNSKLYLRLTYAHVLTYVARHYGFPMKTEVLPINDDSPEALQAAKMMNALLEHFMELCGSQKTAINLLKSLLIFGAGFLYTGWDFVEETLSFRAVNEMPSPVPGLDPVKTIEIRTAKIVTKDQPVIKYISPFDEFHEPGATSIESARYAGYVTYVSAEHLRQNEKKVDDVDPQTGKPTYKGMYINVDRAIREMEDNRLTTNQEIYGESKGTKLIRLIRLWTSGRRVIEVAGTDILLRDEPNPLFTGRKPLVAFTYNELPEQLYGEGEVRAMTDIHTAITDSTNLMIDNGNLAVNTVFKRVAGGSNSDKVMKLFPGMILDVVDPEELTQFQIQDSRQGTSQQLGTLMNFAHVVSGNPTVGGQGGAPTASQSDSSSGKLELMELSDGRIALAQVGIDLAWGEVLMLVGSSIQQFMSSPQIVRIVGEGAKNAPELVKVTPEAIIGYRFLYKPVASALSWFGEELRRQQFINFLNIAAKLQEPGPNGMPQPVGNVKELFLQTLELFRIPCPQRFIALPPPPMPMPPPQIAPPGQQAPPNPLQQIMQTLSAAKNGQSMPQMAQGQMRNPSGTPYAQRGPGIVSPDQLPTGIKPGDTMRQTSATGKES